MRVSGVFAAVCIAVFLVQGALVLSPQSSLVAGIAGDGLSVVLAFAAGVCCLFVWRKMEVQFYAEKRGWLLIGVAFLLFALADGIWAYFEFVHSSKFPVFLGPQILWTAGYLFWIAALGQFLGARFLPSKAPVIGVLAIAIALALFHAYVPFMKFIQDGHLLLFMNNLYVSYDFMLLGLVVLVLAPFVAHHTQLLTAWVLLGLAIILRLVFDFILLNVQGYWAGHPAILLYSGTYLLCLLAAHAKLGLSPVVKTWLSR